MSKIYDMVRNEARNALENEQDFDSPLLKPVTVRIPEAYVKLADKIAEGTNGTRQGLLGLILAEGLNEALGAYASVYSNPKQIVDEMLLECGFSAYERPDSAE